MTAYVGTAGRAPGARLREFVARLTSPPAVGPTLAAIVGASAFLIVQPGVGDLWAARARQSAASHGVGLTYWFAWFGGGSTPGTYSVLTPYLSTLFGAALLGALATVALTPLCWRLAQGSAHPLAATWLATLVFGVSLWSGRVPFAVGSAVSALALAAVRDHRRLRAAAWTAVAVLASPVSGAFIAVGLAGVLAARSHRTVSLTTILAAAASLGVVALVFGTPGPQGFSFAESLLAAGGLLPFLVARPARHVQAVVVLGVLVCPLLAIVPNGLGSNYFRLVWICLPVAVLATARTRLVVAVAAVLPAVLLGVHTTVGDLRISGRAPSTQPYYVPLARELDSIVGLQNYRVEVVQDGTHAAAYALLGHASLARGYETQADNSLNAVLKSPKLDATRYKAWLDNNAVGYVALGAQTVRESREHALVSAGGLPYLIRVWSDRNWTLFHVDGARAIVPPPAAVIEADQSSVVLDVPCACTVPVRVRWSKFLGVDGPDGEPSAVLHPDGSGWTLLSTTTPGRYVLHG